MEMIDQQTGQSLMPKIPQGDALADAVGRIEGAERSVVSAVEKTVMAPVREVEDLAAKVEHFFLSTAPADLKALLHAMCDRIEALEAR